MVSLPAEILAYGMVHAGDDLEAGGKLAVSRSISTAEQSWHCRLICGDFTRTPPNSPPHLDAVDGKAPET